MNRLRPTSGPPGAVQLGQDLRLAAFSTPFRGSALLLALAVLASSLFGLGLAAFGGASTANAAPGDAFPPSEPLVFVAQGNPTTLYKSTTNAAGDVTFAAEGPTSASVYNAISYNTADNYLYGIIVPGSPGPIPGNSLIRIGEGGVVTQVGTATFSPGPWNVGAFGPNGYLYITSSVAGTDTTMLAIDVTTGTIAQTITLSAPNTTSDLTFANGYFWGVTNAGLSTQGIVRIDPVSGGLSTLPLPAGMALDSQGFGAAWTFGNGNLGFSANTSGTVYQLSVVDPAASAPTITLVSTKSGPASGNNDGAASPGLPTDLAIVKTGPATFTPDAGTFTYTLTVTNNGPGNSSGYVVDDSVPAPLTNVASPDAACTVTGNDVQCTGGTLAVGASASFTITAAIPAGVTSPIQNTATVTANEADPVAENNTSSTTAVPSSITVLKSAGTPEDVNGNGLTDVGDTIQYSFLVTNTGQVALSSITVNDAKAGAVTCPEATLVPGADETCEAAAVYTVTADDEAAGSVDNTATASGTPPGSTTPITSTPSTTTTPVEAADPSLTVDKSASPDGASTFTVGRTITYSFLVTNTGNVPLDDISIDETAFDGSGQISEAVCPPARLAVADTVTCTASYTVTQADVDNGGITNTAIANGTPPGSATPVPSNPDTVVVPAPNSPSMTIVKSADPASAGKVGDTITYTFVLTNTGNVTLTDVTVNEGEFSGTGELSEISYPTRTLAPGESTSATATYVLTQADVDAGAVTNSATGTGTPPSGPPLDPTPPSETTVLIEPDPSLAIVKSADPTTVAAAGDVVTYSFVVTNTGNVTLTGVTVAETAFSGTGTAPMITCPVGLASMAPGAVETCTATYTATQADVDAGSITNSATATGTPPTGPAITTSPSSATVTAGPTPGLTIVKSADPASAGKVGDTITYTFVLTNTGNVTLTDVTVNEGEFSGTGELSEISYPTRTLAPGESTSATATYVLTQADVDAGAVTNSATGTGTPPSGPPLDPTPPSETTVLIEPDPSMTIVKSVSPGDATNFKVGQELTYSFVVTNTGNTTLTNVTVNEGEFTGSGTLSEITYPKRTLVPGEALTATATYVLTQADVDNGQVRNTATATATPPDPNTPPPTTPPSEVNVPLDPKPSVTIVKSANRDAVTAAGQVVQYSFLITNTGNVTLRDVTVAEGTFTGTGQLSAVSYSTRVLVPGESTVATASYTVTAADLLNGPIKNTATATGTPPGGTPIDSPPSSVSISVPPKPPLASTGVEGTSLLIGGSLVLLLLGGALVIRNRRHSSMR
ncbi:DUF11 domain-containing protein [Plantibacter sp. VKM Ac-2880]|uniref:DUF11 domain-containing protein n=1 Tax=Plantibacter sp. VKM Ac-2880 TaxID=2783827 RepID=UPI00188E7638|nr:DUF11 domain-containing protein [Plantibacter sp. VKM Ac-2880]MBF4570845.1 DUF11 domain-containing protein [Plantibacter sp. VKM Ac-2880]